MLAFAGFFAGAEMEHRLVDLDPLIQSLRPDVVVHEVAELAAPLAATSVGIPFVTVGFGPLLDPAVATAVASVVAPRWIERGLEPPRWGGLYRDLYLDPCPPACKCRK